MQLRVDHACPFCGQFAAISIDEGMTEAEKDALAKAKCGCPDAARERDIKEALEKLEQTCGGDSLQNGFGYPLRGEVMSLSSRIIEALVDAEVAEVQIRTMQGDVLKMKGSSKSVKIMRRCKKELVL